ncbi:hypothetical protein PoB_002227700 [Plakobranchus ocellatus]|uniref:Uncharacterized protein n=1 Tax=Plakobranchus ocellatus TaxID=259542 RepID=A0AAV3ZM88_9GAST|nr:hypothetical protein PoB_002227700 [Plakobranchus ocellatus]
MISRCFAPSSGHSVATGCRTRTRDRRDPVAFRAGSLAVATTYGSLVVWDLWATKLHILSCQYWRLTRLVHSQKILQGLFCRGFEPRYRRPGLTEGLKA